MPRRASPALTDAELRIMRVLWERTTATVAEVVKAFEGADQPAYNTVLTILKILERKGYVTHEKGGRAFVYVPVVDRSQAQRSAVSHLLSRFFNGSPEALVLDLLGHDRASENDRQQVRDLLERAGNQPLAHPGALVTNKTGGGTP
jgi:BlaI family transcriptional regulator, penicillinase repressor